MISTRKTALAVAVSTAMTAMVVSPSTFAVNISTNGLGEVGLIPYYTVLNELDTNVSVVNTSANRVVAFKIRFREAKNSRDVLDFNVFLSPNDVWTANVTMGPANLPVLTTTDTSCTAPAMPYGGFPFTQAAYDGTAGGYRADSDGGDIARTYSGHFEIIEMGIADPSDARNVIARSAVHPNPQCDKIVSAYTSSVTYGAGTYNCAAGQQLKTTAALNYPTNFQTEFCSPENVLKVSANLVSVSQGMRVGIPVDMLANFHNPAKKDIDLMFGPSEVDPQLSKVEPPTANFITDAGPQTVSFVRPIDAVSALFSSTNVSNEYITGDNLSTDWVITFPTKQYYVDSLFNGNSLIATPFKAVKPRACDRVTLAYFDQEETKAPQDSTVVTVVTSPYIPTPATTDITICNETQLVGFGSTFMLGDAGLQVTRDLSKFANGWMRLVFPDAGVITGVSSLTKKNVTFKGLPVNGFAVTSQGSSATSTIHAYGR